MDNKKFKPMLGVEAPEDKTEINFPVIASFKLDGIRAIFHPELGLVSRSLKPIKNKQLREKFSDLIKYSKENNIILDGEFYEHDLTFQQITSLVMTENFMEPKTISKLVKSNNETLLNMYDMRIDLKFNTPLKYHIFDWLDLKYGNEKAFFNERSFDINYYLKNTNHIRIVNQVLVNTSEELDELFEKAINNDYEGLIIRNPESPYKFGRSTVKEQGMLKYKPFVTYDAKIIDVTERFENTNESFKNELGQSTKRNTIDNKKGTGIASAFVVRLMQIEETNYDLPYKPKFNELKVTLTGNEDFRREIWDNKENYVGKMIEFKGMDVGSKNVPRHPTFLRFREDRQW